MRKRNEIHIKTMTDQTIKLLTEIRSTLGNDMPDYLHVKIAQHINDLKLNTQSSSCCEHPHTAKNK